MKKISVIGATLLGATVLCTAPISLHLYQDKGMSLLCGQGASIYPCWYALWRRQSSVATEKKTRHAFKRECKQAWKAQKKAA